MSFNVGINVLEVDGRVAPSIQAAPTSQTGFIVRTDRGVPDHVRRITSFKQFTQLFGSYRDDAHGAFALKGFFDNGGTVAYVTRVVRTSGTSPATTASRVLEDGTDPVLTIRAGYRGEEDPGAWGNRIGVRIAPNPRPSLADDTYDLFVTLDGEEVEAWEALNVNAGQNGEPGRRPTTTLNDEVSGSKYITVEVPDSTTTNPEPTSGHDDADEDDVVLLEGGADDTAPSATALSNAFERFDTYDVQLICCPESSSDTVVTAGLTFSENRGDCTFLGATPENHDREAARDYGQDFQGEKVYGALYFPWIKVTDPRGGRRWVPPTGHVAGVYARTERERGVWKAPAGNAARVNGALDIREHISNVDHTDLVKNGSVNAIRFVPGQGIVVDSSRTLSTSPLWLYVNVRLLFNFVKSSLKDGLRWVVQEPNDDRLWNKVKFNTIRPFLMGLWRRGAFGPGSADEVFTIKIDEENNPPENIQQGIFTAEVYFYPSRPAETVIITVGQQEGGGSSGES